MDFKHDEKLIWKRENGSWEHVRFVKISRLPFAQEKWVAGGAGGTVETFPDQEPTALILRANGEQMAVFLSELRRPE